MLTAQGAPTTPFYGMAVFEAESMENIMAIFTGEEYNRVVIPDEEKFFDRHKTQLIAGHPATIIGS